MCVMNTFRMADFLPHQDHRHRTRKQWCNIVFPADPLDLVIGFQDQRLGACVVPEDRWPGRLAIAPDGPITITLAGDSNGDDLLHFIRMMLAEVLQNPANLMPKISHIDLGPTPVCMLNFDRTGNQASHFAIQVNQASFDFGCACVDS